MAVKLHRCRTMWLKGPHPCWKVQKALDDAGVEYEVVTHPVRRGQRTEYIALSRQKVLPAVELKDGTVIRRESKELIGMIQSGQFAAPAGQAPGSS